MRNVHVMKLISLLNEGAPAGTQALGALIAFGAFASLGKLGVFIVLATFGLFAALGLLALFSVLGEFGSGGACGVLRAFGLLDAFDAFGVFGMFGSIDAFSACGLLGVLSAFGRFGLCPPCSACLVRLARTSCSARSALCSCFRVRRSVCDVDIDARVGVVVGACVGVGVAVGFYVGGAVFLAAELIWACALIFLFALVACASGSLNRAVARVRDARMFIFYITSKQESPSRAFKTVPCLGNWACRAFLNVIFDFTSAAKLLVARPAAQPLQRLDRML